jgi:hypothetical protein
MPQAVTSLHDLVPAIAYAGSEVQGGNGFVASFVTGLAVGTAARSLLKGTTAFAEAEGQLLTLLTFLLFGAVVAGQVLSALSWQLLVYALASLLIRTGEQSTGECPCARGERSSACRSWPGRLEQDVRRGWWPDRCAECVAAAGSGLAAVTRAPDT